MKSHSSLLLLFFFLLATASLSCATSRTTSKTQIHNTKPNPSHSTGIPGQTPKTKPNPTNTPNPNTGIPGFGSGGGFGIPGFGNGNPFNMPGFSGGWGGGYSGPSGGRSFGGVVVPSVVCSEKGPCYKKRVTCPQKCFSSYGSSGKNYGAGGGGGGCTIDCKKRCIAYC